MSTSGVRKTDNSGALTTTVPKKDKTGLGRPENKYNTLVFGALHSKPVNGLNLPDFGQVSINNQQWAQDALKNISAWSQDMAKKAAPYVQTAKKASGDAFDTAYAHSKTFLAQIPEDIKNIPNFKPNTAGMKFDIGYNLSSTPGANGEFTLQAPLATPEPKPVQEKAITCKVRKLKPGMSLKDKTNYFWHNMFPQFSSCLNGKVADKPIAPLEFYIKGDKAAGAFIQKYDGLLVKYIESTPSKLDPRTFHAYALASIKSESDFNETAVSVTDTRKMANRRRVNTTQAFNSIVSAYKSKTKLEQQLADTSSDKKLAGVPALKDLQTSLKQLSLSAAERRLLSIAADPKRLAKLKPEQAARIPELQAKKGRYDLVKTQIGLRKGIAKYDATLQQYPSFAMNRTDELTLLNSISDNITRDTHRSSISRGQLQKYLSKYLPGLYNTVEKSGFNTIDPKVFAAKRREIAKGGGNYTPENRRVILGNEALIVRLTVQDEIKRLEGLKIQGTLSKADKNKLDIYRIREQIYTLAEDARGASGATQLMPNECVIFGEKNAKGEIVLINPFNTEKALGASVRLMAANGKIRHFNNKVANVIYMSASYNGGAGAANTITFTGMNHQSGQLGNLQTTGDRIILSDGGVSADLSKMLPETQGYTGKVLGAFKSFDKTLDAAAIARDNDIAIQSDAKAYAQERVQLSTIAERRIQAAYKKAADTAIKPENLVERNWNKALRFIGPLVGLQVQQPPKPYNPESEIRAIRAGLTKALLKLDEKHPKAVSVRKLNPQDIPIS